jgi:hypothetical protein
MMFDIRFIIIKEQHYFPFVFFPFTSASRANSIPRLIQLFDSLIDMNPGPSTNKNLFSDLTVKSIPRLKFSQIKG